jgi:hypothetical protein
VEELSSTASLIALGAAAVALLAVVWCAVLQRRLARLRAAQRVVLGEQGATDLVGHAAGLEQSFRALHDYVHDVAERLDGRLGTAEERLDGAVSHRGLVRYDAYNEMSGRQSLSIALLDAHGSGVVLSSIHHREQARLYAKFVREGRGDLELSPEEEQAVQAALTGESPEPAEPLARPRRLRG